MQGKEYLEQIRLCKNNINNNLRRLDELREMANRTPFDDRGNPDITIDDISPVLVLEHLKKVNSKLAQDFRNLSLEDILDNMDLFTGPKERRMLKNVAAMMFCENPSKFFPYTQVDIVIFPNGLEQDPNNMIEVPKITGPVPSMIKNTLEYLRTNIVKERIIKPKDRAESERFFNYPYQAFEEAVVNALYHRDYQEREPVEIRVEPSGVSILSYAGPDRSISMEMIKEAKTLRSRRYRNRRLGEFLKELNLTEGRATGIPTIQSELRKNGSPAATIETDEPRSYFLIDIPCHPDFITPFVQNIELTIRQREIVELLSANPMMKLKELTILFHVSSKTITREINVLKHQGVLTRRSAKGQWVVLQKIED